MKKLFVVLAAIALLGVGGMAQADFSNGFETDINGWSTPARVASGTGGVTSATGDYHAQVKTDFTRWGGYESVFPTGGYTTSLDIYLNTAGGWANDKKLEYTSAISRPNGDHLRDFVFNGGFYTDLILGNRFIFSASNTTDGWPNNPGRNPITISNSGWYTFQHIFRDNGAGILAVDLMILDTTSNMLGKWTLSDSTDIIGTTVGGNRYGWFPTNGLEVVAIDNTRLTKAPAAVPEPATLLGFGLPMLMVGIGKLRGLRK